MANMIKTNKTIAVAIIAFIANITLVGTSFAFSYINSNGSPVSGGPGGGSGKAWGVESCTAQANGAEDWDRQGTDGCHGFSWIYYEYKGSKTNIKDKNGNNISTTIKTVYFPTATGEPFSIDESGECVQAGGFWHLGGDIARYTPQVEGDYENHPKADFDTAAGAYGVYGTIGNFELARYYWPGNGTLPWNSYTTRDQVVGLTAMYTDYSGKKRIPYWASRAGHQKTVKMTTVLSWDQPLNYWDSNGNHYYWRERLATV
ncbi:hypothetical protein J6X09_02120, partial [Candidatus Saccharibacteria bacterium]|nr:hypothetical protein [Candidatus Saccharibacteria bacterium]